MPVCGLDGFSHVPVAMLHFPVLPALAPIESDGAEALVGICCQPDLFPSLRPQPVLHQTQKLPANSPALTFPEDGDNPHFSGPSVAHREARLSSIDLAKPPAVGILHHLAERVACDSESR